MYFWGNSKKKQWQNTNYYFQVWAKELWKLQLSAGCLMKVTL